MPRRRAKLGRLFQAFVWFALGFLWLQFGKILLRLSWPWLVWAGQAIRRHLFGW